jgi:hypothetical protein
MGALLDVLDIGIVFGIGLLLVTGVRIALDG